MQLLLARTVDCGVSSLGAHFAATSSYLPSRFNTCWLRCVSPIAAWIAVAAHRRVVVSQSVALDIGVAARIRFSSARVAWMGNQDLLTSVSEIAFDLDLEISFR